MYIRSRAFHWWCKHAKISQKWKHQNWIKWAYISLQVSTQESTSVWRKAANHRPIFSSPDFSEQSFQLSWPIRGVVFAARDHLRVFPACFSLKPEFRAFGASSFQFWRELFVVWRTFTVVSDVYKLKISFVTLQGPCAMAANTVVNGITSQAAEAKKRMTKEDDEG